MTTKNSTYTPKGLTQNWSIGGSRAVKSSGPFQSKADIMRRRHVRNTLATPTPVKMLKTGVDKSSFSVKVIEAGGKVVTRVNGKFVSPQAYSSTLAEKLGL